MVNELTLEQVREVVLARLAYLDLERIAVFGSFARGEAGPESDIDLLLTFKEPRPVQIGLFELARLHQALSAELGRSVDIVSANYMRPSKREAFEEDSILLYKAA